jgi:16S rRNA pseudouridine516 synthase
MTHRKYRLDRFISARTGIPKGEVRLLLAQKRIELNGQIARDMQTPVDYFSQITLDGQPLQNHEPCYLMLHKPPGILSATRDNKHTTVIDLLMEQGLTEEVVADLHITGRLDAASSGLLLLTNDSHWSRTLMSPDQKITKTYEVTVQNPISDECIHAFAEGMYFPYENITTLPAVLERLTARQARVTLMEGKYHQIKRMFGRFRNPVLALHRISIGPIQLDPNLLPGEYRMLTAQERLASGT